jgi:hypothetical protein
MKRTLLLLCFALAMVGVSAQNKSKKKAPPSMKSRGTAQEKFLNKQFWLGFKAGPNLTQAVPQASYSVITPTNYDATSTKKKYRDFNDIGGQATLEFTFYYKGISISAQPTYRTSRFAYQNMYSWKGTDGSGLDMKFQQQLRLDNFDLPLLLKYEFTQNKLRPYLQAGVYYSILLNATKGVTTTTTNQTATATSTFVGEPVVVGANDLFTNSWGLVGGLGLNYSLGNVRLVFDASYHMGMSNIANVKNRYSNDRLSGIGDAQDDIKINNIVISLGCLFPLRFLSNNYKSLD